MEREHPLKILATLQTTFRKWIKIKMESQDKNSFEISKILNLNKFAVEQDLKKLKEIPLENLIHIREKLTQSENFIKTGAIDARISVEIALAT